MVMQSSFRKQLPKYFYLLLRINLSRLGKTNYDELKIDYTLSASNTFPSEYLLKLT